MRKCSDQTLLSQCRLTLFLGYSYFVLLEKGYKIMAHKITEADTGRGVNFIYGSIGFHSPEGMPGMGGEPLRASIRSTASTVAMLSAEMLPERLPGKLLELVGTMQFNAAGDAINTARRAKSEAIAADLRHLEPALAVPPAVAVEHRSTARALPPAEQSRWTEAADLEGLTAIVDGGNRAALPGPIYDRARERYWIANWALRHAASADHAAQPSLNTILATGADADAVRAEAEKYREQHRDRMIEMDRMEASAQSLVAFLAAVFGIGAGEALDRAMGRHDA